MKILYLAHDVGDPAVAKRVAMLRNGGAAVTLAGFRRAATPIAGAIDLGQTHNGKFLARIVAVMHEMVFLRRYEKMFHDADLVIARTLEMLAIASRGCKFCSPKPVLVYECLDIHRLLLNEGLIGRGLRWLEGRLAANAAALITSSPAFVSEYFKKRSHVNLPIRLVENKLYTMQDIVRSPRLPGPPWRIGWFGAIRCRDSLRILCDLARAQEGGIEIIIRGRPAYDQFDDFDSIVARSPHVNFLGPYNSGDLAMLYHDVHFTWAIDHFEAGQNSAWLLPNRLYEGGAYASVPLSEKIVETGRFLDRLNIGITLQAPLEENVQDLFQALTPERYHVLQQAASDVPLATWVYTADDAKDLVAYLQSLIR